MERSRSAKRVHVKRERTNKTKVRYNVDIGSINYEHSCMVYIAKMEGIVSVIVTAVDIAPL